ncbi:MAG: S8 family peptidase, partial [Planctomycetota bacterium]
MKSGNCLCQIITVLAILVLPSICPTVPVWGQTKAGERVSIKQDQQEVTSEKLINPEDIMMGFEEGQATVKVIVNLAQPLELLAATDWDAASSLNALHAEIQSRQEEVLSTLSINEFALRRRFENQAGFSGEVTLQGLEKLLSNASVESIEPVRTLEAHLAQGIALINASTYRSSYNGEGMAIAICDTGIDYTHPKLGNGGFPNSKVIGGYDFGDDDADPFPCQAHGTSCAGLAAGDLGSTGDYIGGVAHNAKLYALKISPGCTSGASSSDMVAAWDWCVTHWNDDPSHPIKVISTSFGGYRYFNSSSCDASSPAMTTAANNAVAVGITVLASSGNDGWCDSMGWPACISSVVSVGAVYDAAFGTYQPCVDGASCATRYPGGCLTGWYAIDNTAPDMVTSYSNTATFLDILAPANEAYTTDITGSGGYSTSDYYDSFGGTSAACPYAVGVVACLQSAAKARTGSYLSPSEVRNILATTGDDITDEKVAITKVRVNLGQAIDSLGPPDDLSIALTEAFNSSGDQGGPFTPACKGYTLTNIGPNSLDWTATKTQPWLNVTPGSGTLAGGASTIVDVCINANATSLPTGNYNDTVTFTNTTSGIVQTREVTLEVRVPGIIFSDDMESGTNNWSLDYPWGL